MFSDGVMFEDLLTRRIGNFKHLVIIGMGNELGGDDGAGIQLSRQMKKEFRGSGKVTIIEAGTAPENYASVVQKLRPSHVLIVDAAKMGLPPGSLQIVEKNEITGFGFSTHSLPLSIFISYLEDNAAASITVVGIEPLNTGFGKKLSKPVVDGIGKLMALLRHIARSAS